MVCTFLFERALKDIWIHKYIDSWKHNGTKNLQLLLSIEINDLWNI